VVLSAPAGLLPATAIGGLTLSGDLTARERAMLPIILPTMHLSWGRGFLTSRVHIDDERHPGQRPSSDLAGRG